jgi:hypothetical protein
MDYGLRCVPLRAHSSSATASTNPSAHSRSSLRLLVDSYGCSWTSYRHTCQRCLSLTSWIHITCNFSRFRTNLNVSQKVGRCRWYGRLATGISSGHYSKTSAILVLNLNDCIVIFITPPLGNYLTSCGVQILTRPTPRHGVHSRKSQLPAIPARSILPSPYHFSSGLLTTSSSTRLYRSINAGSMAALFYMWSTKERSFLRLDSYLGKMLPLSGRHSCVPGPLSTSAIPSAY